jgi:hypothetical protein
MTGPASGRLRDSPADLDKGFFERPSTTAYIEELAALPNVTLLAGAGVSADLGAPLWTDLMTAILLKWTRQLPELMQLTRAQRKNAALEVIEALGSHLSPAAIGSILRTIAASRHPLDDREKSEDFRREIRDLNRAGRTPGGFLARSVGILALSLRQAGRPVTVVTTNYDDHIEAAMPHIHRYVPALSPFELVERADSITDASANVVPVIHLNGSIKEGTRGEPDRGLVIGEADFFARYGSTGSLIEEHSWRSEMLDSVLGGTSTVFIGSSVTDPDILSALALTKGHGSSRYSIQIRPDMTFEGHGKNTSRRLADSLLAARFEHLGVVPIFVDFKHQVPQLLREVALKVRQQDGYQSYMDRLNDWWGYWSDLAGGADSRRSTDLQNVWHETLRRVRDIADSQLRRLSKPDDEMVMVEVWLRDHHRRLLVHWANSESLWLYNDTAHVAPIASGNDYQAQNTFREGRTVSHELHSRRGHWVYCVSMPLVLHEEPWFHLPVGVLNVLSSKKRGALRHMAKRMPELDAFENAVKGPVSDLLDPLRIGS